MIRLSRNFAVALVAGMAIATIPAGAQFPPTTEEAPAKKKGAPAAAPNITGNWVGDLTQVGSPNPYKFEISVTAKGAETKYPDLDCLGKLTRAGSSKSYVFFIEVITKGQAQKGGRCPDGTITVARAGDKLAVGWFGSIQDTTVVAYGTLGKK